MKKIFRLFSVALFFAVCAAQMAGAATFEVEYVATKIDDANRWQYDYTIFNNSPDTDIGAIDLLLWGNDDSYRNMEYLSPNNWINYEFEPIPDLDEPLTIGWAGFDLNDVLVTWISPGESLGGFSMIFDWFGQGNPASQQFIIYDTNWNDYSGFTILGDDPAAVPEPGTLALLGSGVVGLFAYCRARNAKKR